MNICNKCNKTFANRYSLKRHTSRQTECGIVHGCPRCQKVFPTKGRLDRHIKRKTPCGIVNVNVLNDIDNTCNTCFRKFSTTSNLRRHAKQCVNANVDLMALIGKLVKNVSNLKTQASPTTINNINNINNDNRTQNIQNIQNNIIQLLNADPDKRLLIPFQNGVCMGNADLVPEEITEIISQSKMGDLQSQRTATVALALKTFSGPMRNVFCLDPENGIMLVLTTDNFRHPENTYWEIRHDIADRIVKRILTTSQISVFKRGKHMDLCREHDDSRLSSFMFNVAIKRIPADLTAQQTDDMQKAIDDTCMDIRRSLAIPDKYLLRYDA
jgi:hypothetical protein